MKGGAFGAERHLGSSLYYFSHGGENYIIIQILHTATSNLDTIMEKVVILLDMIYKMPC